MKTFKNFQEEDPPDPRFKESRGKATPNAGRGAPNTGEGREGGHRRGMEGGKYLSSKFLVAPLPSPKESVYDLRLQ